jgi:hypothetical protein
VNETNGLAYHDELKRTSQRWPVATAAKVDRFLRDSIGDAAAVQSRRVLAAAQAELDNRALRRFCEMLYEERRTGELWNVGDGGQILIPTPWSRTRYAAYGLTDHGGRVLRSIMVWRLGALPAYRRWLELDGGRWYLNLRYYGTHQAAKEWMREWAITGDLWLEHNDRLPRRGHK